MQWLIINLLIMAICELPIIHAKKLVVMMPRQVRRSPSSPWRHLMMMAIHAKRTGFPERGTSFQRPDYSSRPQYYTPKNVHSAKDEYPQGGDDFDQGHEEINNVIVPHGKGITHAVSFGKGYIPFETYRNHRPSNFYHQDFKINGQTVPNVRNDHPANYAAEPTYGQAYISQQAGSYINNEYSRRGDLPDKIQEGGIQKYVTEKPLYDHFSSEINEQQNDAVGHGQGNFGTNAINLSPGSYQKTLGSSESGIVLRDSIVLDDYYRKIAEFTKNWPPSFSNANSVPERNDFNTYNRDSSQQNGLSRQLDSKNVFQDFFQSHPQSQQGYAVKEDVVDTPHDFRSMPIQTSSSNHEQQPIQMAFPQQPSSHENFQHLQPVENHFQQQQQQALQQEVHQQPVQQPLQHITAQFQIPANYPLHNY